MTCVKFALERKNRGCLDPFSNERPIALCIYQAFTIRTQRLPCKLVRVIDINKDPIDLYNRWLYMSRVAVAAKLSTLVKLLEIFVNGYLPIQKS